MENIKSQNTRVKKNNMNIQVYNLILTTGSDVGLANQLVCHGLSFKTCGFFAFAQSIPFTVITDVSLVY